MKSLFIFILFIYSFYAQGQVICGTANENGTITLTAPAGNTITSIQFASYGTPAGSCGSFTIGACHATNSLSIVTDVFVGNNSASIAASNGVFGDPCGGTVKRLYIQAFYSLTLPLTLVSFTAKKTAPGKVRLDWYSEHEINTSHFMIESSINGIQFNEVARVSAKGSGENNYHYSYAISDTEPFYYFRLKMADQDGQFKYSKIVRYSNHSAEIKIAIFPNPSHHFITITGNKNEDAFITHISGKQVQKINLINGSITVNISALDSGVYFIKTPNEVVKFMKN